MLSDDSPDVEVVLGFVSQYGVPVFPVARNSKTPAIRKGHGYKDATRDEAQIRAWAEAYPHCNWAMPTGRASGFVVVDVDVKPEQGKHGDETLAKLEKEHGPLPETAVVTTPNSGQHLWFRTNGTALVSGTDVLGSGLDVKADGGYIMLPPSRIDRRSYEWEASSDPAEVGFAELPAWIAEIATAPKETREQRNKDDTGGAGRAADRIANVIAGNALHDSLRDLAAHYATAGTDFAEIVALLEGLMHGSKAERDERWRERFDEIPKLVNSAVEKFRTARAPNLSGKWAADIVPQTTGLYLVKGLIPARAAINVYGTWSAGKTAVMIDIAGHVALSRFWRGLRVRGGGGACAYFALENVGSVENRVAAWCLRHGIDRAVLPLLVVGDMINFLRPGEADRVIAYLREQSAAHGPFRMCVWDTFARLIPGGEENSSADMSAAIGALDQVRIATEATQVGIHHAGKDLARGSRGWSGLPAAVDTEILIADDVIEVKKQRDGETAGKFGFHIEGVTLGLDEDGDEVTAPVAIADEEAKPKRQPAKLSGANQVALDALREVIGDRGTPLPMTSGMPPGRKGVTEDKWREQFGRRYGGETERRADATARAFRRAKEHLLGAKLVGLLSPWCWIW
jgi:hypothetical protein